MRPFGKRKKKLYQQLFIDDPIESHITEERIPMESETTLVIRSEKFIHIIEALKDEIVVTIYTADLFLDTKVRLYKSDIKELGVYAVDNYQSYYVSLDVRDFYNHSYDDAMRFYQFVLQHTR